MPDLLRINDDVIDSLRGAIFRGNDCIGVIPNLLKRILKEGMWKERIEGKTGELVKFSRFEEFVSSNPLAGLGASMQLIKNLVRDDPEALDLLDRAMARAAGNPTGANQYESGMFDNIQDSAAPTGTSAAAAIRRLRKDRPDLHAEVLAGKKTPHAAMIEAGFRRKPSPLDRLKSAWGAADESQRKEFLEWIES